MAEKTNTPTKKYTLKDKIKAMGPGLLLLDEPTASLDNASKLKVRTLIEQLKAEGTMGALAEKYGLTLAE